jgi:predicted metalloprotease with PDZ domain
MMKSAKVTLAVAACLLIRIHVTSAQSTEPTQIQVDATQAPMGLLHTHLIFPASPGHLVISYPKWIPGEHAPTGPINQVIRLVFSSSGKQLKWRRDELEPFSFHLDVPPGAKQIEADLDFACEIGMEGFTPAICSSANQLVLNWNMVVLYNPSTDNDRNFFRASLRLPNAWKIGTPLPVESETGGNIQFKTVSLKTLVDSPVIAGANFQSTPLGGDHPVVLDAVAETSDALQISPEQKAHFSNLVTEATALFGGSRYDYYHMLLTLGDSTDHYTLEHFMASENRMPNRGLLDPRILLTSGSLVPHEYIHSWNGKYRPPVNLDNKTFLVPISGSLLWVYEGLTDYYGNVLAARAGFWTEDQFRQSLAVDAAQMANHPGRTWRSLQDTNTGAQLLYNAPAAWAASRRSTDFYPESGLMWLDADTLIRERSHGQKSLDDFCRAFFAPQSGHRQNPYTFDDVVRGMNAVVPYDWSNFFRTRLDSTSPQPPFDGIERGGWKLQYSDKKSELIQDLQDTRKIDLLWPLWEKSDFTDLRYSIGLLVYDDGTIIDSSQGMAAYNAGVVPGMRILGVNGSKFSIPAIESAVNDTKSGKALQLELANGVAHFAATLDYHEGAKYPALVRRESQPDMLSQILAPRAGAK